MQKMFTIDMEYVRKKSNFNEMEFVWVWIDYVNKGKIHPVQMEMIGSISKGFCHLWKWTQILNAYVWANYVFVDVVQ